MPGSVKQSTALAGDRPTRLNRAFGGASERQEGSLPDLFKSSDSPPAKEGCPKGGVVDSPT